MLWVTGHPSHTPQAPSSPLCGSAAPLQGEMAAAELGVLWQSCPPLTSPPAPGCQGWCLSRHVLATALSSPEHFGVQLLSATSGEGFDPQHHWQVSRHLG